MSDFNEYKVGVKVLSAAHQQPGVVVETGTQIVFWAQDKVEYFDVKWDRWPDKPSRRYYNSEINDLGLPEYGLPHMPTIVEAAVPEFVLHDGLKGIRDSLSKAIKASVTDVNGNPAVDINRLIVQLQVGGWVYAPDNSDS